jgi:hypothetical protein
VLREAAATPNTKRTLSGSDALCHMRWSVDFITNMSESEFSAHTGGAVVARSPSRVDAGYHRAVVRKNGNPGG